jgi:hypothetical protein
MKSDHLNKFFHELLLYFWIPIIVALVSYVFFELHDPTLGISVLLGSTTVYAMARLYATYKKWWLLLIMGIVVLGSVGIYFLRAPAATLTINDQQVTGTSMSLPEGTITVNPAPQGNGQYTKNTVVTLTAEPAEDYDWISWNGTDNDTANPTTVTMDGDKSVNVNFEERYSLIINNQLVIGSVVTFTEGSVTVNPPPSNLDGKYTSGTLVTLTVQTNPGYEWQGWTGTNNDTGNPTTVTMNNGKQITLLFHERYELTINGQTVTSNIIFFLEGSITIDPAPGIDGKYAVNTQVTLSAAPNPGYSWQSWSGVSAYTSNPTTMVMTSDKHITVNWGQAYVVTINNQQLTSPSLTFIGGTVIANPAPMSNGTYAKNTLVTFTAQPAPGYRFGWWGGEISSTTNPILISINSDKNITVVFVKTYALTITIDPEGGGAVSPGSDNYDEGSRLTLTATAAAGYRFDHWDSDVSGNATSVSVTMDTNKNVTAVFVKTYVLTVTITPEGGGTVSPTGGIYDTGANVTLTATPATGYSFNHWEGDASGTATSITITMDSNKSVTAVFIASTGTAVATNATRSDLTSPLNSVYGSEIGIVATPNEKISPRYLSSRSK